MLWWVRGRVERSIQRAGSCSQGPESTLDERLESDQAGGYLSLVVYRWTDRIVCQGFCKEVVTWKSLCHPNVLPLLGVTMTQNQFVLVSGWMENGDINTFVKAHPDVNRLDLVRFLLGAPVSTRS